MSNLWVSDLIKGEEAQWKNGDIVCINSGTGTGKSQFVRKELSKTAEYNWTSILFVFNRSKLYEQNDETISKENNFTIKIAKYQEIENVILKEGKYDFSPYKYIVCDECHYFTDDSPFNDNSDLSLNAILALHSHIRVFMSATGDTLFKYIKSQYAKTQKKIDYKIWSYGQKRDYSHISSLSFYSDIESLERFVADKFSAPNDKILYFCRSVKIAAELHQKYPNSYFMCSKSDTNKKYFKFLDDDAIVTEGEKITFNRKYLFTTKVLDNGFDLKDSNIKLIICDEFDINTMIQCIGRKRSLDKDDKVNIVLLNHTNKSLNGYRNVFKKKIDEVDALTRGGIEEWSKVVGRFGRRSSHIVNDNPTNHGKFVSKKTPSRVKYLKAIADFETVSEMLRINREVNKFREVTGKKRESDAYSQYIMNLLEKNYCSLLDKIYEKQDLTDYLASIVGQLLFKTEQQVLIEKFNLRDYRNRLQKDVEQLKRYLQSNGYEYELENLSDNRRKLDGGSVNPNRNKTYWTVTKL